MTILQKQFCSLHLARIIFKYIIRHILEKSKFYTELVQLNANGNKQHLKKKTSLNTKMLFFKPKKGVTNNGEQDCHKWDRMNQLWDQKLVFFYWNEGLFEVLERFLWVGVTVPSKLTQSATFPLRQSFHDSSLQFSSCGAVTLSPWFILFARSRGRRVEVADETQKQLAIRALQWAVFFLSLLAQMINSKHAVVYLERVILSDILFSFFFPFLENRKRASGVTPARSRCLMSIKQSGEVTVT